MNDLRRKIYEDLKVFDNEDFNEVCEMEEEYSLEFLLIYLWQNGSWTINQIAGPVIINEFEKLFIKSERKVLYKGMHFESDTAMNYDDICKNIEWYFNDNKYISFTDDIEVSKHFTTCKSDKPYTVSCILKCETNEYIDVDQYRDLEEKEFIIKSKEEYTITNFKVNFKK